MINPPIYRLTTAVSDIDQTNINRDIRDGNWLSIGCRRRENIVRITGFEITRLEGSNTACLKGSIINLKEIAAELKPL